MGIEGLPPVEATIAGAGPIDDFEAKIAMAAGTVARTDGNVSVRQVAEGHPRRADGTTFSRSSRPYRADARDKARA